MDNRATPAGNTQVLAAVGWAHKVLFGGACNMAVRALSVEHSQGGSVLGMACTPVYTCRAGMACKDMAEDNMPGSMAAVDSSCIDTVPCRMVVWLDTSGKMYTHTSQLNSYYF